jgi:hypothetical protein
VRGQCPRGTVRVYGGILGNLYSFVWNQYKSIHVHTHRFLGVFLYIYIYIYLIDENLDELSE